MKHLELFNNGFDSTIIAEKTEVENWPYVGYSPNEGVVFTVIPEPVVKPEIRMVLNGTTQTFPMSANGLVIVESVQNGEKVRETYSDLSDTNVSITTDEGTEVVIYGEVTKLQTWYSYPDNHLTSLDVSNNTALTYLDCNGCADLTSLDVSNNTALTYLDCSSCSITSLDLSHNTALTKLCCFFCNGLTSLDLSNNTTLTSLTAERCDQMTSLDIQNTQYLAEGYVLSASMSRLKTLRVAGTSEWAYAKINSWLRGLAPQSGTILVDENTPSTVLTSAEAKNWTIEHIDA